MDKVAWVSKYDPRNPSKSKIIHNNLNILCSNPDHEILFPRGTIIGADRRGKNIGELCKPTTPRRFPKHGPANKKGFFTCKKHCDTCRHSGDRVQFSSRWDNRKWYIRDYITCTTPNVIYILECKLHPDFMYVGSTMNFKSRWANHKSDAKNGKAKKCWSAKHVCEQHHPKDDNMSFFIITPIEIVKNITRMADRELYWQANLGTIFTGGNSRRDIQTVRKNRIQFDIA